MYLTLQFWLEMMKNPATAMMNNNPTHSINGLWTTIWKLKAPQRAIIMMWVILHDKLMTDKERYQREIAPKPFCNCCPSEVEDLNHLFRYCTNVGSLWPQIMENQWWSHAQGLSFRDRFAWNMRTKRSNRSDWSLEGPICYVPIYCGFGNGEPEMLSKVLVMKN